MSTRLLIMLLVGLASYPACAQVLPWSIERPLTWADFKGEPPRKTRWGASAYTGFGYQIEQDNMGKVVIATECSFHMKKSWRKTRSLYALRHEQSHFDITELYARKLREQFTNYQASLASNEHLDRSHLRYTFDRIARQRHRCQRRYDRQTRHGRRQVEQAQWNDWIATELKRLQAFTSQQIPISRPL